MFCLLMMTMPLSGCMDNSDDSTSEEENVELQDWHVHFAVNAADLPTCNEDTNGRLYYVESDNEFQVCKSTGWEIISIKGTDGVDGNIDKGDQGIPSTLVNILSSTNCENDGYKFEIGTLQMDGILTSDEVTLTTEVCNGKNGIDGADGQDGAPGLDGTDGVDGVQGPMGDQGPQGPAGNDGTNGVDGQDGAPGADGATTRWCSRPSRTCKATMALIGADGQTVLKDHKDLRVTMALMERWMEVTDMILE